jgi:hypothetical protein
MEGGFMTPSVPVAGVTPVVNQLPTPKNEKYSLVDIVFSFLKEKPKDIIKALGYGTFWAGQAMPGLPSEVQTFSLQMGEVKNLLSAIEIPDRARELSNNLKELLTIVSRKVSGEAALTWGKVTEVAAKTFKAGASLANNACDGIDFSSKYIPFGKEFMHSVKTLNYGATFGGALVGAGEQVYNLNSMTEINPTKTGLYLINLARDVSYLVLGGMGLFFIATATPIATVPILACATSGLIWTITGFFYERMLDPENKGKNLNPAIVVQNVVAGRATAAAVA